MNADELAQIRNVPISFNYNGKNYKGHFSRVHGMGGNVWHLMINNYYHGCLQFGTREQYYGNSFEDLANFFIAYMISWLE